MRRRGINHKKELFTIIAGFGIVIAVSLGISTIISKNEAEVLPGPESNILAEDFTETVEAVDSNQNAPAKTDNVIPKQEETEPTEEANNPEQAEPKEEDGEETSLVDEFDEVAMLENEVTLAWPVKGEIALDFSGDGLVYDPTLEQFRANDTVCILAAEGTDVMAACDGVVESVKEDYEKGMVVVIGHGDGWSTTYSQMSKNVAVAVGDTVTKGQVIGKVAMPTKYGAALGSHLEFKVCQGSFAIDPKIAIAE